LFFSGAAAARPRDILPGAAAAPLKNKKVKKDTTRSYKQATPLTGVTNAGQ
jgi:hypothetical protein